MPLYEVPLKPHYNIDFPIFDYTVEEKKEMWKEVLMNFRIQTTGVGRPIPAIYVSLNVFIAMSESDNFVAYNFKKGGSKLGSFYGATVYLSTLLLENEYYIGVESSEILQYQRKHKLDKITNKLNVL